MNSILLYTNNVVPKKVFQSVLYNCVNQAYGVPDSNIVIVSHYPVISENISLKTSTSKHFDTNKHKMFSSVLIKEPMFDYVFEDKPKDVGVVNIVVGENPYCMDTIYRQILIGLDFCGDYVSIFEHDVLYPYGYFKKCSDIIKSGVDICFWKDVIYFSYQGFFRLPESYMFSRFSFFKNALNIHIKDKMDRRNTSIEPALKGVFKTDDADETEYENFSIVIDGEDVMDIKHGFNLGGYSLVEDYMDSHTYWGEKDRYLGMIDQGYVDATQKNLNCFYGFSED